MLKAGDKLKELRETKKLSQGEIEKRTVLLRCYEAKIEKPNISFSKAESARETKQDSKLRARESTRANERHGPEASASHGFENGEPGVGDIEMVAIGRCTHFCLLTIPNLHQEDHRRSSQR